jgi:hypothetical protein
MRSSIVNSTRRYAGRDFMTRRVHLHATPLGTLVIEKSYSSKTRQV